MPGFAVPVLFEHRFAGRETLPEYRTQLFDQSLPTGKVCCWLIHRLCSSCLRRFRLSWKFPGLCYSVEFLPVRPVAETRRSTGKKRYSRLYSLVFTQKNYMPMIESLVIKQPQNTPTNEFSSLTRDELEVELGKLRRRETLFDATEQVAKIGHYEWSYELDHQCKYRDFTVSAKWHHRRRTDSFGR